MCVSLLLVSVLIAIWSYSNTIPRTTRARRNWLITLRSLAIACLLFVIFQPILSSISTESVTPQLAVVLDNSQSMLLQQRGFVQSSGAPIRRDVMISSAKDVLSSVLPDANRSALYTVGEHTLPFPN